MGRTPFPQSVHSFFRLTKWNSSAGILRVEVPNELIRVPLSVLRSSVSAGQRGANIQEFPIKVSFTETYQTGNYKLKGGNKYSSFVQTHEVPSVWCCRTL